MIRNYDFWLDEKLSPSRALAKSQQWLARTTVSEKISYFDNKDIKNWNDKMPENELEKISNHRKYLMNSLIRNKRAMEKTFNPIDWSGFFLTGV